MNYDYQNDSILEKVKEIIIKAVSPRKIILFGSRARGEANEYSDYDILVIKDDVENERHITRKINYELLNEDIDTGIDILATSTEKWDRNKDNIAYIYKSINSEGIILYERRL